MVRSSALIRKLKTAKPKAKVPSENATNELSEYGTPQNIDVIESEGSSSISSRVDDLRVDDLRVNVAASTPPSKLTHVISQEVSYVEWTTQKRFTHRYIFITWANDNSKLSKDILKEFVCKEFPEACYVICEELTKAGKPHFHMIISSSMFDLTSERRFQIKEGGKLHIPYIVSPKTIADVQHVIYYMQKSDKNVLYKGYSARDGSCKRPKKQVSRSPNDLVNLCKDRTLTETFSAATELGYDDKSVSTICKMHEIVGKRVSLAQSVCTDLSQFKQYGEFHIPKIIKRHYELYIGWDGKPPKYSNRGRIPMLIIVAPPWLNKTSMIRSLSPHLYFQGAGLTLQDFTADCEIPSEVKCVVIDDASGLFKDEKAYDKFGKAMMTAKGDFRAHLRNLTNVKCSNELPVIWIQNCSAGTYRFWEHREFNDWMIDSTCVEMYPLNKDLYESIQSKYRDRLLGDEKARKAALIELTNALSKEYNPGGKILIQLFSLNKDARMKAIERAVLNTAKPTEDISEEIENFKKCLYGDIDADELGVYAQWESLPDDEEKTYETYYRMMTDAEAYAEAVSKALRKKTICVPQGHAVGPPHPW